MTSSTVSQQQTAGTLATESMKLLDPPLPETADGATRRVGVEIEFASVSADRAARLLAERLGGTIEARNPHAYDVVGTELGDFSVELDAQYIHKLAAGQQDVGEDALGALVAEWRNEFQRVFGDISSAVVPCEVVCPPLDYNQLPAVDSKVIKTLINAGAEGTGESWLYGFGVHLNPEAARLTAENITATLQAYLLLSDWLRAEIGVDVTRRVFSFIDPFPHTYLQLVLDPGYHPELANLIGDYLAHNPTRNRELDMLPLFTHLDSARVRAALDDPLIKGRPAYHYRLPNAALERKGWTVTKEWNRWVAVEELADDESKRIEMIEAFTQNDKRIFSGSWLSVLARFGYGSG